MSDLKKQKVFLHRFMHVHSDMRPCIETDFRCVLHGATCWNSLHCLVKFFYFHKYEFYKQFLGDISLISDFAYCYCKSSVCPSVSLSLCLSVRNWGIVII